MTITRDVPVVVVDGDDRAEILRFASIMLSPSDRCHAERVMEMAAPLLEWAAEARDGTDLRLRIQAMRRQHANTPMAYSRPPVVTIQRGRGWLGRAVSFSGGPDVWLPQSVITTPGRFLAEASVLYDFMAAGR